MKNGLKKLLGVYQKGIECIQDYEGIGYLETCQVFYLEALFLIISLVINKIQIYEKGDNFIHWLLYFKYDLRILFIIEILIHIVSIYVRCYFKKNGKNNIIKEKYVKIECSISLWIIVLCFIVSMSIFPILCLAMLFLAILMPIFVVSVYFIIDDVAEQVLKKALKWDYQEKDFKKQMRANIFLACEYVAMILIFEIALSFFDIGILLNLALVVIFIFFVPFMIGMSNNGYSLFEAILNQPVD